MIGLCLLAVLLIGVGLALFFIFNDKDKEDVPPTTNGGEQQRTSDFPEIAPNGYIVYFNPETGQVGTEADYNANTGASDTGNTSGFMKWYVFNDDGGDRVNLLLDHNTTATVQWGSNPDSPDGKPDILMNQLAKDVAGWTNEVKTTARLISANEVALVMGISDFDSALEDMESHALELYGHGWLYDRTSVESQEWGAINNSEPSGNMLGYWTSSYEFSRSDWLDGTVVYFTSAWAVWSVATLGSVDAEESDNVYGIRPAISILRTKL